MALLDLFSKRQKRVRGEVRDVLTYDELPNAFRVQMVHILSEVLGSHEEAGNGYSSVAQVGLAYQRIVSALRREYGVFELGKRPAHERHNFAIELFNFILQEQSVERVLDAVELACRYIDQETRNYSYRSIYDASSVADGALTEINSRFLENGVGFRYEADQIIRVDSEVVHAEVVKPALALLHDAKFKGAEAEFHSAFEHYRHGRAKEALTDCLKSLESTMKSIAAARKWKHSANATAQPLIALMFEKALIPGFWATHFSGLRAMLEGGVPTVRNRQAGHGQGVEVVEVPPHLVAFALHQTAAAIVFLVAAEQNLP
ncbi:MAG: STM4504/CBY_0614 family protein [Pseudomonadota bacterium]